MEPDFRTAPSCDTPEFEITDGALLAYHGTSPTVRVPQGVRTVFDSAFRGRKDLVEVFLPDSVTTLMPSTFDGCTALRKVRLPEPPAGDPNARSDPFRSSETSSQAFTVGAYAFADCHALEELIFPVGLLFLPTSCCENCYALRRVVLPEGLLSLQDHVFSTCTSLREIDLPSTVRWIGDHAFGACSELQRVRLPDEVQSIGSCAFRTLGALRIDYEGECRLNCSSDALGDDAVLYAPNLLPAKYPRGFFPSLLRGFRSDLLEDRPIDRTYLSEVLTFLASQDDLLITVLPQFEPLVMLLPADTARALLDAPALPTPTRAALLDHIASTDPTDGKSLPNISFDDPPPSE